MPAKRLWIDTVTDFSIASGAAANISLMTGVSSTQTRFDQMTLVRTIIGCELAYTVHDFGEGSQVVFLGIGMTSQEAFAAGSFSDPDVNTDFPVRGWVWRAGYRIFGFAADQPAVFIRRIDLDLRSQRKLENGEMFLATKNNAHEGATGAVDITGMIRQLWLVS